MSVGARRSSVQYNSATCSTRLALPRLASPPRGSASADGSELTRTRSSPPGLAHAVRAQRGRRRPLERRGARTGGMPHPPFGRVLRCGMTGEEPSAQLLMAVQPAPPQPAKTHISNPVPCGAVLDDMRCAFLVGCSCSLCRSTCLAKPPVALATAISTGRTTCRCRRRRRCDSPRGASVPPPPPPPPRPHRSLRGSSHHRHLLCRAAAVAADAALRVPAQHRRHARASRHRRRRACCAQRGRSCRGERGLYMRAFLVRCGVGGVGVRSSLGARFRSGDR